MTPANLEAKDKILQATLEMLNEGIDPETITTRDIAKNAGVNLALVNYHFQTKENLIQQAIGIKMQGIANEIFDFQTAPGDPVEKLRRMLKRNSELGVRYRFLMKTAIAFEIKSGSYATVQTIMPILKDIFLGQKTERELQLIAIQLLVPLQTMFIHHEVYQKTWGLDLVRIENIHQVIDTLIDNLVSKPINEEP